jgi:hypothetical protein
MNKMPYKITGNHLVEQNGLSLKDARELVAEHLKALPYEFVKHESILVGGKLMHESHFIIDDDVKEDADIQDDGRIELAKIEYMSNETNGN